MSGPAACRLRSFPVPFNSHGVGGAGGEGNASRCFEADSMRSRAFSMRFASIFIYFRGGVDAKHGPSDLKLSPGGPISSRCATLDAPGVVARQARQDLET